MKRAVSLSLGTSRRNFSTRLEIFGEEVEVRRIGCDGDLRQLASLLRHFDGRVQALGLGGMNFAYRVGARAYAVAQAAALRRLVRRTPLVDGSLLKDTVERRLVVYLAHEYGLDWPSLRVLVVSALDRFGLTEALVREGAAVVIGDALFGLRLPLLFSSLQGFALAARLLLPLLRRLPLTWFYPTGAKQDRPGNSRAPVYRRVQVIAGDFHFLWRYLPADLAGKGVIASSLWPEEYALLRTRGAAWVATPLPAVEGRSWAANIWEAALTAAVGRTRLEGWGEEVLWSRLQEAGLRPRMEVFHGKTGR